MSGKLALIAVLFCLNQLAFGGNLQEEKQNALKKMKMYSKSVVQAYDDICKFYHTRKVYLDTIKTQKVELGQSLRELNTYEINKIAEANKQKGNLLSTPQSVLDCIQTKKEKFLSKAETTFSKNFSQPVEDLRVKASNKEQMLTDKWHGDYYGALEVFDVQFDRTSDEINSTDSKAYLEAAFSHFEKIANQTLAQIYSLPATYAKNEVQFERTLEKGPMTILRTSARRTVDDFLDAVEDCFLVV